MIGTKETSPSDAEGALWFTTGVSVRECPPDLSRRTGMSLARRIADLSRIKAHKVLDSAEDPREVLDCSCSR